MFALKIMCPFVLLITLTALAFGQQMGEDPQLGRAIYETHCVQCYGLKGDGNGPDTQFLIVPPANFHSLQSRSKTDLELASIIMFGVVFSPMHGWGDRLTEQEIWDVLSYIRLLAPFNPVT